MPKLRRTTSNPLGKKLLEVMRAKGITDDYVALAEAFGVKVPSVYDWIDHGRLAKERYPQLVEWSGRSLDWWFDIPTDTIKYAPAQPSRPVMVREPHAQEWPFPEIDPGRFSRLAPAERMAIAAYVQGVIDAHELRSADKRPQQWTR